MNSNKIMPGVVLVLIGALFLLNNYNVINFHWGNLIYLWPIFLIMGGVNLVFANNKTPLATIIKIGVVVLGFGLIIFVPNNHRYFWNNHNGNFNLSDGDTDGDNDEDSDDKKGMVKVEGSSSFAEPLTAGVTVARLNIHGGGAVYNLKDTTSQMFQADTKEYFNRFEYSKSLDGTIPVIDLRMKGKKNNNFEWDSDNTNSADIKLSAKPEWEINIKTGASKTDFDLSQFKIKTLNINGGAASYDIKMGLPLAVTTIEVSTGVSEVHIRIPKDAACRITTNSGLSSNDFDDFDKKGDNQYETAGFDAAKNKMYINLKGGVSDFNVGRY